MDLSEYTDESLRFWEGYIERRRPAATMHLKYASKAIEEAAAEQVFLNDFEKKIKKEWARRG